MKVVVADDLGSVRRLVAILSGNGFDVLEAPSMTAALGAIDDDVALVLTDIEMPGGSGVELIERIRRQRPSLPVIAMSGHALRLNDASRAGATALALKPFTGEELLLATEVCLAPRRLEKG